MLRTGVLVFASAAAAFVCAVGVRRRDRRPLVPAVKLTFARHSGRLYGDIEVASAILALPYTMGTYGAVFIGPDPAGGEFPEAFNFRVVWLFPEDVLSPSSVLLLLYVG